MVSGKKILVIIIFLLLGMGLILLGWVSRSTFEGHRDMYSCKVTCADKCPALPVSVFAPFIKLTEFYWIFMMIGSILIGLSIGRMI